MRWQTCGSMRWCCWAITPSIHMKYCANCSDVLGSQVGESRSKQRLPHLFPSRAFRKYATSYFGLCPTETIAVGQTCLYSMARSTCHELTKRSTSSKGSSDTCISDGVSTFLYRAFMAHGTHLVGIHSRFSLFS